MAGRIPPEVRAARAAAIFEAEEKAKANPPDPPAFSTLIGWAERPAPKPPAIQAGSGLPGEANDLLINAGEDPEPLFRQLDPQSRKPKPRGPKR